MFRKQHLIATCVFASALVSPFTLVQADPLPGGDKLKFMQRPMAGTPVPNPFTGATDLYYGHDNPSTAYLNAGTTNSYSGFFFADDFADLENTPVVHVRWWGSYPQQPVPHGSVQKFLLAWETDVPVGPGQAYSQPGTVIQSEIVTAGALSPGSGTFTETLYQNHPNGEHIYQYNAELALPFNEQANVVYWLKIVALVDPTTEGNLLWGWHNRDYTIQDTLASVSPQVIPGERDDQPFVDPTYPTSVWHFQDDAVRGGLNLTVNTVGPLTVSQFGMTPSNYNAEDGLSNAAYPGIVQFSQDLAFELYTIPEPASLGLLAAAGAMFLGRRSRRA